ncbi:MAG: GNAT family N-acetyltransferase, partial [Armatimonadetes bacterium]|nr:GNAT family N-acetyltransferase [Armatimonadota bacterium]
PYPDSAARAFMYMWQYSYNLRGIYETPSTAHGIDDHDAVAAAAEIISRARDEGRTILTEYESKQVMALYGIPTVETRLATTPDEAVAAADAIGYPVVVKLHSNTITHKTDVGGVLLNLGDAEAVRKGFTGIEKSLREHVGEGHFDGVTVQPMVKMEGYEIILGSSIDPQFGPVLLFGTGGQLVEVFKDRALSLPPLTTTLARRMMEKTNILKALKGVRGRKPVDIERLEQLMVRFSYLVVEQRWVKEIDINPVLASGDGLIALDARVVLFGADTQEADLPRLAIRPYPSQYVAKWALRDGTEVVIRPIRPDDEPLVVDFHQTLSEQTVYLRFFHAMQLGQRTAHDRMVRICFNDYDREIALVAEYEEPAGKRVILGVARLTRLSSADDSEFSLLVNDKWHGRGLGTELLRRLIEVARDEKIGRILADIIPENYIMQHVCEKLGFQLTRKIDGDMVKARIEL